MSLSTYIKAEVCLSGTFRCARRRKSWHLDIFTKKTFVKLRFNTNLSPVHQWLPQHKQASVTYLTANSVLPGRVNGYIALVNLKIVD